MYESYLKSLTTNPLQASYAVCETFFALHNPNSSSTVSRKKDYHKYIELYVILQTLLKKCNIECRELELKNDIDHNISLIVEFFIDSRKNLRRALDVEDTQELIAKFKAQYETSILQGFSYEFDDYQLTEARNIIAQIQAEIKKLSSIDYVHKARLKASVDRLEKALHKNMSNMDRFWGLMFEIRLVLKGRPEEIQDIIDLVHDLATIFYQIISRSGDDLPFKIQNFLPREDASGNKNNGTSG